MFTRWILLYNQVRESWLSGPKRGVANPLSVNSLAQVRILYSPHFVVSLLSVNIGGIEQWWLTSLENWGPKGHVGSNPSSSAKSNLAGRYIIIPAATLLTSG